MYSLLKLDAFRCSVSRIEYTSTRPPRPPGPCQCRSLCYVKPSHRARLILNATLPSAGLRRLVCFPTKIRCERHISTFRSGPPVPRLLLLRALRRVGARDAGRAYDAFLVCTTLPSNGASCVVVFPTKIRRSTSPVSMPLASRRAYLVGSTRPLPRDCAR